MSYALSAARGEIDIDTARAVKNVRGLGGELDTLAGRTGGALGAAGTAVGAGLASVFVKGVSAAATFETAMDGATASLGGLNTATGITTDQFVALETMALDIGASTSAAGADVARVIDLMAKGGAQYETILEGGARGVVNLAEATGESFEQSASSFTSLSNLFADTGISASDMTDTIVAGMNSSDATLSEFQTGLTRMAPLIKATGMDFREAAGLIAYFNAQGLSAAEVGTSMNSAFTKLTNQTPEGIAKMQELGIVAFDTAGNFVGMPALFDQVSEKLGPLSEEARMNALSLMFGADAADIFAIAMGKGGEPVRALIEDMDAQGLAAEMSALRMDNLEGSVEKLSGAWESLMIKIGKPAQEPLKWAVDLAAAIVDLIGSLDQATITAGMVLAAPIAAFGALKIAAGLATNPLLRMIPGFTGLGTAAAAIAAPVMLAVGAFALLGVAYKTNFGGFGDWVDGVIDKVQEVIGWWDVLKGGFAGEEMRNEILGIVPEEVSAIAQNLTAFAEALYQVTGIDIRGWVADIIPGFERFGDAFDKLRDQVGDIDGIFKKQGFKKGLKSLFGKQGLDIVTAFGDGISAVPKLFGDMLKGIETGIEPVDNILHNLGSTFTTVGRLIQEVFQGDFSGASEVLDRLRDNLLDLGESIFDGIIDGLQAVPWGTVWDTVVTLLTGAASVLGTIAGAALGFLWDVATAILGAILEGIANTDWSQVWEDTKTAVTNAIDTVIDTGKTVALTFLAKLGEGIFGTGGFTGWIQSQLGYGIDAPDGTGGPNGTTGGIPMGDLVLAYAAQLGGEILNTAKDVGSWLIEKAPGFAAAVVDNLVATLNFAAELGGDLLAYATDAGGWLYNKITTYVNVANLTAALDFAVDLLGEIGDAIADAAGWLKGKLDPEGDGITVAGLTATISGTMIPGTGFKVSDIVAFIKDTWSVDAETNTAMQGVGEEWGEKIGDWIIKGLEGLFSMGGGGGDAKTAGTGLFDELGNQIAGAVPEAPPSNLLTALDAFAAGLVNGIWTSIQKAWGPMIAEWANMILDIYNTAADIVNGVTPGNPLPQYKIEVDEAGNLSIVEKHGQELGTALSSEMSQSYEDAYSKAFANAIISNEDISLQEMNALQDLETQAASAGVAIALTNDELKSLVSEANNLAVVTGGGLFDPSGRPLDPVDGQDRSMPSLQHKTIVFDADNTRAIQKVADIETKVAAFGADAPAMKLPPVDVVDFSSKLSTATEKLSTLDDKSTSIKLTADNSDVTQKIASAEMLAMAWAGTDSEAAITANNTDAVGAINTATGLGNEFDGRVFRARITVDTSGLTNAVIIARQAAADISAVLPRSPAKEGPLSKVPNFDYIAEAIVPSMNKMVGSAKSGVGQTAAVLASLYKNQRNEIAYAGGSGWKPGMTRPETRVTLVSLHSKDWQTFVDRIEETGEFIDDFEAALYAEGEE
jgi:TP901 family phage tail tape measure protein